MRIRKNKENLAVEGTFLPEHSSFLVCQLNRSPWDDDFLFSQFIEEKWDHCLDLNVSLPDFVPPSDRTPNEETIIDDFERTMPSPPPPTSLKPPTKFVEEERKKEIEVVLEAKTTSSQPYRGKRDSYHLTNRVSPPPPSAKKVANLPSPIPLKPISAPRKKRGRPIKKSASATDNNGVSSYSNSPYAFYYYSGFSPSWSKRRSGDRFSNTNSDNTTSKITTTSVAPDVVEGKKAKEHWFHGVIGRKGMTHGSSSSIMSGGADDDDNANISSINKMGSNNNDTNEVVSVVETVVDERLDYIDDDEEQEDGGLHGAKRIRSRKPIKARSLKSFM